MDRYYMKATSNAQSFAISGIPSPPSSDSSQNYTNRERSSMTHDNTLSLPVGRQTPPYSSPGSWNSTVAYAMAPSHDMNEQPAYDMSIAALAVRPRSQQQLPQQAFYTPPYGSPVMPAPSSLLGPQIAEVPNYTLPRTVSTYQSPLPPIAPSAHDYASPAYGHNPSSAGTYFLPAPGSFTWQPTPYSQPYIQSRMWEHQSQIYRPSRPTTIFGRLPREAWERVFQYLEYADRLRLQRGINRFWRESLKALDKRIKENPSDADFADMHSLVLQAENYSKHWAESTAAECGTHRGRPRNNARKARTPPQANDEDEESKRRKEQKGSLGCYHCFTVRPPEKFCLKTDVDDANVYGNNDVEDSYDMPNNVREGSAPRRYCLDCGIKKGFHPPNKYLERKRGIETRVSTYACHQDIETHHWPEVVADVSSLFPGAEAAAYCDR
ncbi:hypothetical protein CONLIGDRAFT_684614 [Coniochaeta ligniaria NRRL 30616]|uniref:F-box domain-containing protein n=1 Tax=Coniochaeta ligniaria NRRL 30616 TaxID=1408157 RepID=A0A1J7IF95_9PEZI|nr:hypothetical protein CONLIGDRAFT_684614 [Coniochaeta ligniaria NRRL 30616]